MDVVSMGVGRGGPCPPWILKFAVMRILKQNLHMAIIYDNKPRPAARGNSQTIASEGCKKKLTN